MMNTLFTIAVFAIIAGIGRFGETGGAGCAVPVLRCQKMSRSKREE
jgi:hypothetical protein